jgi:hypothetical protein
MRPAAFLFALLVAGCTTAPEPKAPPRKAVVAKAVKPEPKAQTFKERWLFRFFRERAQ